MTEELGEQMDQTSAELPAEESEFEFAGLTPESGETVDVSRVAESPVHLEGVLYDSLNVYTNIMILGKIVHIHIDDSLLTDGKPDMHKINAVGRLGGPYYTDSKVVDLERKY